MNGNLDTVNSFHSLIEKKEMDRLRKIRDETGVPISRLLDLKRKGYRIEKINIKERRTHERMMELKIKDSEEIRKQIERQEKFQSNVEIERRMKQYICPTCHGKSDSLGIKKYIIPDLEGISKKFEELNKVIIEHNQNRHKEFFLTRSKEWGLQEAYGELHIVDSDNNRVVFVDACYSVKFHGFELKYVTCPYCNRSTSWRQIAEDAQVRFSSV